MAAILLLLWLILLINSLLFSEQLDRFGIVPRTVVGLRGIAFAPFLHVGVRHLAANSVGLALLGGLVLLRGERDFWIVALVGAVVGGGLTWCLGRPSIHLGASGVIFAFLGFLLLHGLFERRWGSIVLSTLVAFFWGGLLFGILPGQPGISWESHLFGFLAGVCAAWLIAARAAR